MRFVRFIAQDDRTVRSGIVDGPLIRELEGDLFGTRRETGETFQLQDAKLLAPLVPRQIIGIGKNFAAPGAARPPVPDMPILFFKPPGTVVGPLDEVRLPAGTPGIKFESEIAVVIGTKARGIRPEDADRVIFGCTVANDFGATDYFHPEGHWTIGKSFDTFCPLGPAIETDFDYRSARIRAELNGRELQNDTVDAMIMPIPEIVAYISTFMTLMPGDVILTGTPAGAVDVGAGDIVDCIVEGIGRLRNSVAAAPGSE